MATTYDICVDYDTLYDAGRKLQDIGNSLHNSTANMDQALLYSQEFLAGEQFERVKQTTENCMKIAARTENNIRYALQYMMYHAKPMVFSSTSATDSILFRSST